MTYQKPKVFFSRLAVGVSDNNRGKCKNTSAPIKVGDLYVNFAVGGAKGEAPTSQTCSLSGVAGFLKQVVTVVASKSMLKTLGASKHCLQRIRSELNPSCRRLHQRACQSRRS